MAENENVLKPENIAEQPVEEQPVVSEAVELPAETAVKQPTPPKGKKGGAVKEWFRKKTVALKRKPQNIALVFLAITTIYFMLALYKISQAVYEVYTLEGFESTIGICIFVTTLLSLLVLVSFLNSFPKRKKPNIFFIVLVFLMIGAMIACDIVYYVQMNGALDILVERLGNLDNAMAKAILPGQTYIIVHVALLGVSAVVFALLPVYAKLINKINTKVELESATENMRGAIDIQED